MNNFCALINLNARPASKNIMKFGGLGIYKKVMGFFRPYDVNRYWSTRGETYYENDSILDRSVQEAAIIEQLKKISFNSVLEFGCGYGRFTKLILDNFSVDKYVAFDLSSHQIDKAKNYCKGYNVDFQQSAIKEFTTNEKFDLVMGIEVLAFITPKDIEDAIRHLLRFTKKHFIHANAGYDKNYKFTKMSDSYRHNFQYIYSQIQSVKSLELKQEPKKYHIFHVQIN